MRAEDFKEFVAHLKPEDAVEVLAGRCVDLQNAVDQERQRTEQARAERDALKSKLGDVDRALNQLALVCEDTDTFIEEMERTTK